MKKLSAFNKVVFFINNIFALLLFLSSLALYIKPSAISAAPILSLATPVLLLVNVILLIYWIVFGLKKQLLLSLIALIISFFIFPTPYKFKSNNDSSENGLSIMSYNVRKFNIFEWIDDKNITSKIDAFIQKEEPDILALQEYKENKDFNINYPFSYNPTLKTKVKSGLAIFSKYPIINTGILEQNRWVGKAIFIDIVKSQDTIRVYNFHLQSLGVVPDEEYFGYSDSKKLIQRLKISFKIQQKQVDKIKESIYSSNYKIILAGDMNNTAYSWAYKNLKNDLKDSFLEAGNGFGKTYNFKGFPLRIDFIFTDNDINIINHKNYKDRYSDHYPVMATVSF
jgi:endonuclease/exonuclease/phosphatase family metal-dependent hydrolase